MLNAILTAPQSRLLADVRTWATDLQTLLARLGAADDGMQTLRASTLQLDELFLLVVVGEFNAGKSAFVNALLGQSLLPEGVTPTTAKVHVLRYGDSDRRMVRGDVVEVEAPVELLKQIHLVDTPGTNAVIQEHQRVTEHFVPRSDLVLFVTSADRPFSESERQFLERIRSWGKKIVFALNKVDLFTSDADLQKVIAFVGQHAETLLGTTPRIFPVSARRAQAHPPGAPDTGSGFDALEAFIHKTLDDVGRLSLKLLNPLGIGERLAYEQHQTTQRRLKLLAEDLTVLDHLERQLQRYRIDMVRDFELRLTDIGNLLYEMQRRGDAFFDEMLRLGRIVDLVNRSGMQQAFEKQVVDATPQAIERRVSELIDWFVAEDLKQWQAVMEHIESRRDAYRGQLIGVGARFETSRAQLIESVGRSARDIVDSYKTEVEAARIADSAQQAVAASAMTEAGAIGLGALVAVLATTVAADITGLIAAGLIATFGFFVIPARKRAAKKELAERVGALRAILVETLTAQFTAELDKSLTRLRGSVAPYTRFVEAEQVKLTQVEAELRATLTHQAALRARIEALSSKTAAL